MNRHENSSGMNSSFLLAIFLIIFANFLNIWPVIASDQLNADNNERAKYVLTFPQEWRRGSDIDFHLVLFEHSDYALPIVFEATLLVGLKTHKQSFIQTKYGLQRHTFKMEGIYVDYRGGGNFSPFIKVAVKFTFERRYQTASMAVLNERFFFVQLDKAVYRPRESVKIVVIGLDRQLKALSGLIDVKIEDSLGEIVHFWPNQRLRRGFFAINVTLSELASEGEWKAIVVDKSTARSLEDTAKSFYVRANSYTPLNKLQVKIDFPSTHWLVSNNDSDYKGYVRAKNLFGLNALGRAVVTTDGLCHGGALVESTPLQYSHELELSGNLSSSGVFCLAGLVSFKKQHSSRDSQFPYDECQFDVTANFTESLTGEGAIGRASIVLYKYPVDIWVHESTPKYFKPGLSFRVRFQVARPDGSPVGAGTRVRVRAVHFTTDWDHCSRVGDFLPSFSNEATKPDVVQMASTLTVTTENGIAEIVVPVVPSEAKSVLFYATLSDQPGVARCISRPSCNDQPKSSISISIADGNNVTSTYTVGQPISFSILTNNHARYVFLILARDGQVLEYRQLEKPTVNFQNSYLAEFRLEVTVPLEAAPRASAVAWMLASDGAEILADAIHFRVAGFVQHELTASFGPRTIGNTDNKVALHIDSNDPTGSTIAILAVGKRQSQSSSVDSQKANTILLNDIIVNAMSYIPSSSDHPETGKWHRKRNKMKTVLEDVFLFAFSNTFSVDESHRYDSLVEQLRNGKDENPELTAALILDGVQPRHCPVHQQETTDDPILDGRETSNQPETWIWQIVEIGPNQNELVAMFQVPDSGATSWSATVIGIGTTKGFGIAKETLQVFRNFSVELFIAKPTVIRGEKVEVTAVVFGSRQDAATDVELTLERSPHFDISHDGGVTFDFNESNFTKTIRLEPNGGSSVPIWIRPRHLGKITLKLTGIAGDLAETIQKEIDIEPEGEVRFVRKQLVLRLVEPLAIRMESFLANELFGKDYKIAINGSKTFQLQVFGDVLGPAMAKLAKQVQLPRAGFIGVQTIEAMAQTVRNYKFLKEVGALTPEAESDFVEVVKRGYNRQLACQKKDGSFYDDHDEDDDQRKRRSSPWITAFVLRFFHAVVKFANVPVDPAVMARAWSYLRRQVTEEGLFDERIRKFDNNEEVAEKLELASLIYAAHAEAGCPAEFAWKALFSTRSLLMARGTNPTKNNDAFQLSLAAYALSLVPDDRPLSKPILDRLVAMATKKTDGSIYWEKTANQIGTAGYVLLAMVNHENHVENAIAVARWLVWQPQFIADDGSSMSPPLVVIEALAEASRLLSSRAATIRAKFNFEDDAEATTSEFRIQTTNAVALQTFEPDRTKQDLKSVEVFCSGIGVVHIRLTVKYNVVITA